MLNESLVKLNLLPPVAMASSVVSPRETQDCITR